ncbi:hypothetical protein [Methylocystis bryophila]|nr:hypothetical protein [Methylocystis bryophila]BDV40705.1 hypothetical protein DSM21852_39580 [Methylocystis bryophila]
MSGSIDRRSDSRVDRSTSASTPRLRWPPKQNSKPEPAVSLGRGAPADDERQADRAPPRGFVAEGVGQLALSVLIVLVLGFFFLRIFGPKDASLVGAPAPSASLSGAPKQPGAGPSDAAKLEVEFDRSAPAGKPLSLRMSVGDAPEGSTIVISGLRANAALSAGENRDLEWRLGLADLSNLSVIPPNDFVGTMSLVVELRLPDGSVRGRQIVNLEWTSEAAAEPATDAKPADTPLPGAPSEAPPAAMTTPEAAPVTESGAEKQVARALPRAEDAPPPQTEATAPAKPAAAALATPEENNVGRTSPCFAKLDGKIVLQGNCRVAGAEGKTVTYELGENRLSLTLDHGRIWRLKWNDEDKGKIYKREECWGSEKAFVCEHPPRAKRKS